MNRYVKIVGLILFFTLSWYYVKAKVQIDSLGTIKKKVQCDPSFIWFNGGYRMPINKQKVLNSGHGFYMEIGINPGTLISKDWLLGIYAGWAFMDKSWNTSFNKDFSTNYKNAIIHSENQSSSDSAIIYSSSSLFETKKGSSMTMPGCEMNSFHNYTLYYGMAIKLPHKKYPILKLYKGSLRSHYQGDGSIVSENMDFNIFEIRRTMYGGELMVLNTKQIFQKNPKSQFSKNKGSWALSAYYEMSYFYNASLYFYDGVNRKSILLKNFTNNSFLKQYKKEVFFGFKLSFYL